MKPADKLISAVKTIIIADAVMSVDNVIAIAEQLRADGRRVHQLAVSHAFHSPLMDPMIDEFGTPNIFAKTEEGAVFGAGYAQAEDRLAELLKQYRRCEGTMSEVFGPEHLKEIDLRSRGIVLTDDYAPVENLLAPVAATRGED